MFRAASLIVLVMLLAGCRGRDTAVPFAESQAPPGLATRFLAPDGWAWGYVQTGGRPAQRYGVASTSKAPKAVVVILPGYGESAEIWFETVRDLTESGNTVWVLERAGQGGSGRYVAPHDLGYVQSFEPDVSTLKAFLSVVVRSGPYQPLILLGHGDGAVVALRAAQTGARLDGLVLSSPRLEAAPKGRLAGLDRMPSPGWHPWSRSAPDAFRAGLTHDPLRGSLGQAWQTANPDLRMSGASRGWTAALGEASRQALDQIKALKVYMLSIRGSDGNTTLEGVCPAAANCRDIVVSGGKFALHLEADTWRKPWFLAVADFIDAKVEAKRASHVP
jgi:lysophospholipase